ncbi:hypothetical protein NMY22_g18598 [Coprinellus aureogranulatus]|nr:hypothetical protein NMY22_g18598 [Coprinellus aureogranulatus]
MDPETLAKLEAIIKGYRATMYVNYVGVATHALVFADFLHTFPDEVRLMWRTPLTIPTALYFTLRYYILAHQALAILYGLPKGLPPEECKARFSRVALSSLVIATMSEAILFLRVYAFSGKSKKALVLLIFQYLAIFGPAFVLDSKFRQSVKFVNLGIPNLVCMPVESNNVWLGAICALLLGSIMGKSVRSLPVFSTKLTQPHSLPAVMCIMMYIAFKKHRHFSSPLLSVFYSDGVFYFISLSGQTPDRARETSLAIVYSDFPVKMSTTPVNVVFGDDPSHPPSFPGTSPVVDTGAYWSMTRKSGSIRWEINRVGYIEYKCDRL